MPVIGASLGKGPHYTDRAFTSAARNCGSAEFRDHVRIPRIQGFDRQADSFVLVYGRERSVCGLLQD